MAAKTKHWRMFRLFHFIHHKSISAKQIERTLQMTVGNQIRAAEVLGLNRNTLRKKIRDLGLDAGRPRKNGNGAAND